MIPESLDYLNANLITNITVKRNGKVITMTLNTDESVPSNSLCRASILACGCKSDTVVSDHELSKLERIYA